jgi:cell division protein FtsQ
MPRVRHSPRNSVNDRPPGWRLLLRRQRSMAKPLARIVLASIAVVLLVILGHSVLSGGTSGNTLATMRERIGSATAASGLRVAQVLINGRANTPEPLLRAAIGVSRGDPILGFSLEQARARIETLSWVEHATVERRLPDTVMVSLQERRPFAIWQNQGKYLLVDRAGQVVADQDVAQFRRLPLIVGRGAPVAAAELLDALSDRPALAEKVLASVRVGERRWNLRMASGSDVMLPEGHEVVAIDRLMQLQQDHAVLDRPLAAIDLRLPDRLVLRPAPGSSDIDITPPLPPGGPHPAALPPPTVPVVAKKPT